MRPLAVSIALLVSGLLGGWVASAGAGIPPLPPVPRAPQVPTLPLLPPAPPRPPAPQVPQASPVPLPKTPAAPAVSHPSAPGVGGLGNSLLQSPGRESVGTAGAGSGSKPASSPRRVHVYRLHFSRDWIARSGPKKQQKTVLVFFLRKPALVEFVVIQVSPECRRVGRFRVQGRRGRNRVRFRGRIGRAVLRPGTYLIRARAGRRRVVDTRLVVVRHAATNEIAAARRANACGSPEETESSAAPSTAGTGTAAGGGTAAASPEDKAGAQPRRPREREALGARFAQKAVDVVTSIPLWLFALLGLAIAQLAVAALPLRATPSPQTAVVLAHRRGMIALSGAGTLLAVTVAYALLI